MLPVILLIFYVMILNYSKNICSLSKGDILNIIFSSNFFNPPERRKQKIRKLKLDLIQIISSVKNLNTYELSKRHNIELLKILDNKNLYLHNPNKLMNKEFQNYIKQNYPIQTWLNNPILRTKSKEVNLEEIKSDKIQDFAQILFAWMEMYDGIWLAAPQIWENIRMIAVCQLDKKEKDITWAEVLINPKIIEKSWEYISEEGCLSLPWLEGKVKRYKKVKVEYYDINWEKHSIKAENLNAAILQHEIDHLNWILFWDKVINKWPHINFNKMINL